MTCALHSQADQRGCDRCSKVFTPRQRTGGSTQRFCSSSCRLDWHKERQRAQRIGLYAGRPTVPATPQPEPSETQPSDPGVRQLHAWETGVLDIADCDRVEFVLALKEGETASTGVETWPMEVRALVDRHVSRWVDQNKETYTVQAMTVAVPKYDGVRSVAVILHHCPRK
jgi:hypothetical protein